MHMSHKSALRILYSQLSIINLWHCHMVSVPEAPIHEYARPVLSHNDVWLPWQSRVVQPIAVAMTPQPFAHNHFRLCVLAVNGCHIG